VTGFAADEYSVEHGAGIHIEEHIGVDIWGEFTGGPPHGGGTLDDGGSSWPDELVAELFCQPADRTSRQRRARGMTAPVGGARRRWWMTRRTATSRSWCRSPVSVWVGMGRGEADGFDDQCCLGRPPPVDGLSFSDSGAGPRLPSMVSAAVPGPRRAGSVVAVRMAACARALRPARRPNDCGPDPVNLRSWLRSLLIELSYENDTLRS